MPFTKFVLGNLALYREFDQSNFISNANNSINNKVDLVKTDVDLKFYSNSLNKTLSDIDNISIHSDLLIAFFSSFSTSNIIIDTKVSDIIPSDVFTIKPIYLEQFLTSIGLIIDRTMKNKNISTDIDNFITTETVEKIKKQMVKTNLSYMSTSKDILMKDSRSSINMRKIDDNFIKDSILPFVKGVDSAITEVRKDILDTIATINTCSKNVALYNNTIESLKQREDFSEDIIKKINYITYNSYRALIDATSFLTSMVMRKASILIKNITNVLKVYGLFAVNEKAIEMIESSSIIPDDTHNLVEDMVQGRADAFIDIADNIFSYNNGIMTNSPESPLNLLGNTSSTAITSFLDKATYDKTIYDDMIKMFLIIDEGLSSISSLTDDYILVTSDVINNSGFDARLCDRFKTTIDAIDDISKYTSASNLPTGDFNTVYFDLLAEVRDYGENMTKIAKSCSDCYNITLSLIDRYKNNVNQEYANTEAVNELNLFFEDFLEDFKELVTSMVSKFMLRLKNMNIALSQLNNKRVENYNLEDQFTENTDFNEELDILAVEFFEAETDLLFESMMRDYIKAREMRDRGAVIIFEDGNSENTQGIMAQITKWFENLMNKLQDIITGPQAKKDAAYLNAHKAELLGLDYSGLSNKTPIFNYEALVGENTITTDLGNLKNRVNKDTFLKTANLTGDDLIKIFFPTSPPLNVFKDKNIADAVTKYYKVGNQANAQPQVFSGDALKNIVTNGVTYCDKYYSSFLPSIKTSITAIKDSMSSAVNSVISQNTSSTGSVTKPVSNKTNTNESAYVSFDGVLYTEDNATTTQTTTATTTAATASTPSQTSTKSAVNQNTSTNVNGRQQTTTNTTNNNQNNNNNNQNTAQKNGGNAIKYNFKESRNYVMNYCNGLLTAIFDRYKDYMALCRSLVPDTQNNNQNNNAQ